MIGPEVDPHGGLRAAARARAERTVTRLQTGIQAIQERHERVTAHTIERETGLTFKTIQKRRGVRPLHRSRRRVPSSIEAATYPARARTLAQTTSARCTARVQKATPR
jgi:hypothetical protein